MNTSKILKMVWNSYKIEEILQTIWKWESLRRSANFSESKKMVCKSLKIVEICTSKGEKMLENWLKFMKILFIFKNFSYNSEVLFISTWKNFVECLERNSSESFQKKILRSFQGNHLIFPAILIKKVSWLVSMKILSNFFSFIFKLKSFFGYSSSFFCFFNFKSFLKSLHGNYLISVFFLI